MKSPLICRKQIPVPIRILYYLLKPLIPRSLQLNLRRRRGHYLLSVNHYLWPIDPDSETKPKGWPGWPDKKQFALILTHDIEGSKGVENVPAVMRLEKELGFRSSFNFVGKDYPVPERLHEHLRREGFEIGVHGLHHNGMMFAAKSIFRRHAKGINACLRRWKADGFRSPSMHQKLEWMHNLDIRYDSSTFDTDPFEPQPDALRTIFPLWIVNQERNKAFVELPYTLPQDFTLFVIFRSKDIGIWMKKLDWVAENGGMALLITHPDYMCWNGSKPGEEEYPAEYHRTFLEYIRSKYQGRYWHALPREIAAYYASTFPSNLLSPPK